MSNLWDLSHIQPETRVVLEGDTIPAMFWNGVRARGPQVWMRQKELGIWRSWTWDQTGTAVREIGNGLLSLGFAANETASILSNTVIGLRSADLRSGCGSAGPPSLFRSPRPGGRRRADQQGGRPVSSRSRRADRGRRG